MRLCAGCRAWGALGIPHSLLCITGACAPSVKRLSANVSCRGQTALSTEANQTGHQGHPGRANSPLVASPSTLGDQLYLMVKGLAGLAARTAKGWALRVLLCLSQDWGRGWLSCVAHSTAAELPSTWIFLREREKKVSFFPLLVVSAPVLVFSLPLPWNHV